MFQDYFIKYGSIDFVKIVREKKKNGKENNYAFVMFKKPESLDTLLEESEYHTVGGFKLQCLRLLTRDELK
jgi:RNA recognition motif-containing protein